MSELTFQSGTSCQCARVIVNDDSILENNEFLLVELTTADEAVQLNPSSANISIIDNDSKTVPRVCTYDMIIICWCYVLDIFYTAVTVGMQLSVYSVPEGNGLVRVCAVLTGMTERTVLVDLQTLDGTAQGILSTYVHSLHLRSFSNRDQLIFFYSFCV